MAVLEIARLGNPILRKVAEPVDLTALAQKDGELQRLIDDMIETMRHENGAGIAAPQVSRSLQIVVFECEGNERYPDRPDIPLTVLVNPVITRYSGETVMGWEGCLSLVDLRGLVPRSQSIRLEAYDRWGQRIEMEADDFRAVVIQHETDHLLGKVFLDRMTDMTQLAYQKEFETYWLQSDSVEV